MDFFISDLVGGRATPQSNDVMLGARELIYVIYRLVGSDVPEFNGRV
jgi:hypothetical protein